MGWRSKAEKAKKGHRPSLKDWSCDKLYKTFPAYRDSTLAKPNLGYEQFVPFPHQTMKRKYHYYMNPSSSSDDGDEREQKQKEMQESDCTCASATVSSTDSETDSSTDSSRNAARKNARNGKGSGRNGIDVGEASMIPARMDARTTPPSQFHSEFEAKSVPTVITNIPQGFDVPLPPPLPSPPNSNQSQHHRSSSIRTDDEGRETTIHAWKALSNWDLTTLASDETLRERMFKCGEDDDGKSIKLKLKHFIRYLHNNKDDSPLYVFDSSFEDDRLAKRILSDYRVPSYFNEDLFHLVGEKRRPPYRWFLIGPERSGTCVHIDPLATSAWNTLIIGKKRWVLFPPHVPKSIVKGSKHIHKGEDDEAVHYFTQILPRIKQAARDSRGQGKYANFECYEFTQYENETVFIPNGWWHAVLNLTDTVGITQNFCSHRNFDEVWVKTRTGRKKMAYKWLIKLGDAYPHLATRAMELNKQDDFVMKYDPEEVERRRVQEQERERARKEKKAKKDYHRRLMNHHPNQSFQATKSRMTSSADIVNRDAKRSRVERVVSPDIA